MIDSEPDLHAWVRALRDHVEGGELAGHPPIDIGDGTGRLPGELVVRVMLADLDHLDDLPTEARELLDVPDRRRALLDDFRRLRALLG